MTMSRRSDNLPYFAGAADCLDPDADEVLLELLGRDAEPPPRHDMPHRRWVAPPMHGGNGAVWRERAPGWWVATPYKEYWAEQERENAIRRQQALEDEQRERATFQRRRADQAWEAERERATLRRQMAEPAPRQIHDPGKHPAESWLIETLLKSGEYYQVFLWQREWYQNFLGNERIIQNARDKNT
jgi:hypothetical protein